MIRGQCVLIGKRRWVKSRCLSALVTGLNMGFEQPLDDLYF